MIRKKRLFWLLAILAVVAIAYVYAGEVKLTTYYPAPYGEYKKVITKTFGVGDNDGDGNIDSGDAPDPATKAGDVWIKGNVGIGTTSPAGLLHLVGGADDEQLILQAFSGQAPTTPSFVLQHPDATSALEIRAGGARKYNTLIGIRAGRELTTGAYNTALGSFSLRYNTTGGRNTAVGYSSLYSNTTGYYNTALGSISLRYNTTGAYNTAVGSFSLRSNTTGGRNTAVGYSSLYSNTTGYYNTALGFASLRYNTTGGRNTALGYSSLYSNTTGGRNTALGYQAGRYIANGATGNATSSNSVYLGANTKALASGDTNEIVIGYNATGLGSNSVVLGNDSIVTTALKGKVGIGTTTPAEKLEVAGKVKIGAYTLPNTDGTNGQTLITNGAGTVSWQNVGSRGTAGSYIGTGSDREQLINIGFRPRLIQICPEGDYKITKIDGMPGWKAHHFTSLLDCVKIQNTGFKVKGYRANFPKRRYYYWAE